MNAQASIVRLVPVAALAIALAAFAALAARPASRPPHQASRGAPVRFRTHLVDRFPGGYQCSVADINGDGKPDILALSSGRSEIAWYENPTWTKHVITSATHGNIDLAPYSSSASSGRAMDRGGRPELAVASEFDLAKTLEGGRLQLFKPGANVEAEWSGGDFGRLPTAHRIRWADFDGTGRKELVVVPILGPGAEPPAYASPAQVTSYAFDRGRVVERPIDRSLTVIHGVRVLDFDGDGRDDLLLASFEGVTWLHPVGRGAERHWQRTRLAEGEQRAGAKRGSSEVDLGQLPGGHRFLATIEPWHGNEVVVYVPPPGGHGLWNRRIIDTSLDDGHALACVDLAGDGKSEIVAGFRGRGTSLYVYRCLDNQGLSWQRFSIDEGDMAASGLFVADINGDGRPDIVCIGSATNNLKWYENLGP